MTIAGRKFPRFKGVLGKPIRGVKPPQPVSSLAWAMRGREAIEEHERAVAKWRGDSVVDLMLAHSVRIPALFAHYGITPPPMAEMLVGDGARHGPWAQLAMALANEFVPGFQRAPAPADPGRKRVWTDLLQGELVSAVRTLRARGKADGREVSERDACKQLARLAPWRNLTNGAPDTLYARYKEAKKGDLVWLADAVLSLAKANPTAVRPEDLEGIATFLDRVGEESRRRREDARDDNPSP